MDTRVNEVKLSDGSMVYNVIVMHDEQTPSYEFCMESREYAHELADLISLHCIGGVNHKA